VIEFGVVKYYLGCCVLIVDGLFVEDTACLFGAVTLLGAFF